MNLAEAIGIVAWQRLDAAVLTQVAPTSIVSAGEVWCLAQDLDVFWQDEQDERWRLLVAIIDALRVDVDALLPLDNADDYVGEGLMLSFGIAHDAALNLPSLEAMLRQPLLKRQAWQTCCQCLRQ